MKNFLEKESAKNERESEKNDRLSQFLEDERRKWAEKINPLFSVLKFNVDKNPKASVIFDAQANSLSIKQMINEEINLFLNKRTKEVANLKKYRQEKFIFYATGFEIKTNTSEKNLLMSGNFSEVERRIEMLESHVDFLRDTLKNLESFGYSIKNMIELMNYLNTR